MLLSLSVFSLQDTGADPGFFLWRGCTRLLLYFNTNKPHSFFFLQNTSCIRKPQVISGAHPLHPPPRSAAGIIVVETRATRDFYFNKIIFKWSIVRKLNEMYEAIQTLLVRVHLPPQPPWKSKKERLHWNLQNSPSLSERRHYPRKLRKFKEKTQTYLTCPVKRWKNKSKQKTNKQTNVKRSIIMKQ